MPQRPDARGDGKTDPAARRGSRAERAAVVEQMRKKQESAERRRTIAFVSVAVILGIGLIAAAAIPSPRPRRATTFSVTVIASSTARPSAVSSTRRRSF